MHEIINITTLRRLLDIIGGDQEDFEELVDDYLDAAPELAAKIDKAADEGDIDNLRIAAHTLKSNARDFGAATLSELCAVLERQCREGNVDDARVSADEIVRQEGLARASLKALCIEKLID